MEISTDKTIETKPLLTKIVYSKWFPILTLSLLVLQVQWGLWTSLDLPFGDEAVSLIEGAKLIRGETITESMWGFSWWNSPLYIILYSAFFAITKSIEVTFYLQRFTLTLLSVIVFYYLLNRLLPVEFSWIGAAWIAVSPFFVDLGLDRSDFLAAAIFAWLSMVTFKFQSKWKMIFSFIFAIMSVLFRPENFLFAIALFMYWASFMIYDRYPWSRIKKLSIIIAGIMIITIIIAILGIMALQKLPNAESYLIWVFANNRSYPLESTNGFHEPMWLAFERDYGKDRSISGILSQPISIFRDIKINAEIILTFIKKMSTYTTWAEVSIRSSRWLLGIIGLIVINMILYRKRPTLFWSNYFKEHKRDWLILSCLAPLFIAYLFIRPNSMYLIIFNPLIIAPLMLLIYGICRLVLSRQAMIYLIVVLLILLLSPNPRAFKGDQPIKNLLNYFQNLPNSTEPIKIIGNRSITLCPYLNFYGIDCIAQRWDDTYKYLRLDDFMSNTQYDYFVFDPWMKYLLKMDSGIDKIINNQDIKWKLVNEVKDYKLYEYIK